MCKFFLRFIPRLWKEENGKRRGCLDYERRLCFIHFSFAESFSRFLCCCFFFFDLFLFDSLFKWDVCARWFVTDIKGCARAIYTYMFLPSFAEYNTHQAFVYKERNGVCVCVCAGSHRRRRRISLCFLVFFLRSLRVFPWVNLEEYELSIPFVSFPSLPTCVALFLDFFATVFSFTTFPTK